MNRAYKSILYLMTAALLLIMAACGGLINDDEGDCAPYNYLKITYTMNTVNADALHSQVEKLTIYIYQNDHLLQQQEILTSDMPQGNLIPLCNKDFKPGKYHIVVKGGSVTTDDDFHTQTTRSEERLHDLTCRMRRAADNTVNYKCQPLFYGSTDIELKDEEGSHVYVVDLTKDTNDIVIILQSTTENADLEKYSCTITYDNGLLDYQNNKIGTEQLTYIPYKSQIAEAGMTIYEDGEAQYQKMGALVSRFRLSRLFAGTNPIFHLYVRNEDGTTTENIRIPLIDYILLTRDKYKASTVQELLDREDHYNMTFFLDGKGYMTSVIYINSWKVVVHNDVVL